ncbi:(3,5-dihydroxyphenyl)acetyl-CoA 1,2-dioxygenase DpgC [Sinosporangium siamense]|uniref:Enoyl-CoA hydratase/isomerase family protein n=1 Tax=Sinosporangium siamense TaxID=1367973 RepID=A0A919RIY4_9ACTN|nr:(3,5-dihydroxyphenyl)acetyl-CoA 1,2-dioxygenase DpgC [Sinosporangium siamense]GII92846.1 hypothetical protein Ssi02_30770 [Sinosporangium siamense]
MTGGRAGGVESASPAGTVRFGGDLAEDTSLLAGYVSEGERLLAELPAKAARDALQRRLAADILSASRAVRSAFLTLHAGTVYETLTAARTRPLRLPELVYAAADRFPGLVPTAAQMADEFRKPQAEREGREIDQGVFCGAVLRCPVAGSHLIDVMSAPVPRSLELIGDFQRTGRAGLGSVEVERRGHAAHVTFRNAHCLNAEDSRLIDDLETAVDLVLLDDRVRVGVLRGGFVEHPRYRGRRVFSAGINLKELGNGGIRLVEFLLGRELGYINKIYRGLLTGSAAEVHPRYSVHKPWVGAVDSFAIGGGMQLLLVLDRVIAEEDAYFSLPAAEEGIIPGLGNLRLSRLIGARPARRVILSGHRIRMTDPEAGLVCDEVVPAKEMEDAIERAVEELAGPAVSANRRMLALCEEPLDLFREYLAEFAVGQAVRAYSDDVLAKLERWRRPRPER